MSSTLYQHSIDSFSAANSELKEMLRDWWSYRTSESALHRTRRGRIGVVANVGETLAPERGRLQAPVGEELWQEWRHILLVGVEHGWGNAQLLETRLQMGDGGIELTVAEGDLVYFQLRQQVERVFVVERGQCGQGQFQTRNVRQFNAEQVSIKLCQMLMTPTWSIQTLRNEPPSSSVDSQGPPFPGRMTAQKGRTTYQWRWRRQSSSRISGGASSPCGSDHAKTVSLNRT